MKVSHKRVQGALRNRRYTLSMAEKEAKRSVGRKPEAAAGSDRVGQIDLTSICTLGGYLFAVIDVFDGRIFASGLFRTYGNQEALDVPT